MTMEEAKKKYQRTGLPITNNCLVTFSKLSFLLANSFPNNRPEWHGKPKANQTWRAWKDTFSPLHKKIERETRLARREDSFRVAAAAQLFHNIVPEVNPDPFYGETRVLPQGVNLSDNFDAHFNNLATAATHGSEIVQGTLDHLARFANNQHSEVKKLLAEIKSTLPSIGGRNNVSGSGGCGRGTNAAHTNVTAKQRETLNRRINQLKTAVKSKWIQGGFCSTHGHGVAYKHASKFCHNKSIGHIEAATRTHPAGPGTNKNKGWDDWLMT